MAGGMLAFCAPPHSRRARDEDDSARRLAYSVLPPGRWQAVPNPHLPGIEEEDDDEEHEVEVDIDEEDDDERDQVYPADEPATPVRASFREDREFPSREF